MDKRNCSRTQFTPEPNSISKIKLPYPERMKVRENDKPSAQHSRFLKMFKQLRLEIGLKDALVEMPKFNKWLSGLLRNKEKLEEIAITTLNTECSAIIMNKVLEKLEDPGKFLIPCALQELDRTNALADSRASINLLPHSIYKQLGLRALTPTRMTLELANHSITHPMGIAEDVVVRVDGFTFLVDFVVVNFEPDPRVPIILGRHFLRTAKALIILGRHFLHIFPLKKLLNFENVFPANNEIASLMDTTIRHEDLSGQTSSLFTVLITVIPKITFTFTTTIPPPPHFFNPLPQQATPTPTLIASEATTSFPALPDFAPRKMLSKDGESSRDPKSKEYKSTSSSKGTSRSQQFETGNNDEQLDDEAISKTDWYKKPEQPPTPDPDWNKRQHVDFRPSQTWISNIAHSKKPPTSFDELMDTSIDFSVFVINRLNITNMTQNFWSWLFLSSLFLRIHQRTMWGHLLDELSCSNSVDYSSSDHFSSDDSLRDSSSSSSSESSSDSSTDALSDSASSRSSSDHSLPTPSSAFLASMSRSNVVSVKFILLPTLGALSYARVDFLPSPKSSETATDLEGCSEDSFKPYVPREVGLGVDFKDESSEPSRFRGANLEMDVDVVKSDGIDIEPEIQAEIDEYFAYADALRYRGLMLEF
ncbi:reverse transcriptase domain-containing protein [Tanacetum coccineum]